MVTWMMEMAETPTVKLKMAMYVISEIHHQLKPELNANKDSIPINLQLHLLELLNVEMVLELEMKYVMMVTHLMEMGVQVLDLQLKKATLEQLKDHLALMYELKNLMNLKDTKILSCHQAKRDNKLLHWELLEGLQLLT